MTYNSKHRRGGFLLLQALVFGAIAVGFIGGLTTWALLQVKATHRAAYREQAIQIAEAGIDYYRWHLAHAPQDFQDGTGAAGPYVHPFLDKDGNALGEFTLDIIPPPIGSTIVTVRSTGATLVYPAHARTIESRLAIPSIAKYATLANAEMRFGAGTEVFGPIHSNGGIRFDGLAHNIVTSSVASYNDPDSDDCNNNNSFGVHTCLNPQDPSPPAAVPNRPTVFEVGRQFPVPAVDFAGITADLAQIKADAQANGRYFAGSGGLGYKIVLKTNDTFDLYRVNSLVNPAGGCSGTQSGWGTWSIRATAGSITLLGTYAFPANGLVFVEDHLWIEGQISTARLTIVSARFPDNPATRTSITVNNNLLYTNYDGQDSIGLIAQNNFNVGLVSSNNLRIDAALVAQNGRAGRYYYSANCGPEYIRNTLTLYGMIATNQRYGFAYTDGTGYTTRNINYDANLLYGPPPSFPLTSDQYSILSWEEIK
jgi:hypothetical protein